MRRRGLLATALGALFGGGAAAQEPAPAPVAPQPAASQPAPSQPARRPPRRQSARRAKPQEPPPRTEPVAPAGPVFEAAPVPNRDLEAPRVVERDLPRLSPSVIQRSLPSRGQATEGSVSLQEERLFNPAPGARLNVPFRY